MFKYYAGIGSRKTPEDVLAQMYDLAHDIGERGYILRSGGAIGADRAFETSAYHASVGHEIYYASNGELRLELNEADRGYTRYAGADQWARDTAAYLHPAWHRCSPFARNLHSRNVHQIFGPKQFEGKCAFVVCWTPDGAEHGRDCTINTGGTGMAIRVASTNSVPVFNLQKGDAIERLEAYLDQQPA